MKKSFKDRVSSLGLSYQKEMTVIVLLFLISFSITLILLLFLKEIYIALIALASGVALIYFYVSRYKTMESKMEQDHINELISVLSYFEIFLSNGNNVYNSFRMLIPYCSDYLKDAIELLINQIDVDKTVGPYINFANKFDSRIVDSLMLSIYQMVDNGENLMEMTEFDLLFNNVKNKYQEELIDSKKKSLDSLNSFPLIGAGAITIMLSICIISLIGDYINVI